MLYFSNGDMAPAGLKESTLFPTLGPLAIALLGSAAGGAVSGGLGLLGNLFGGGGKSSSAEYSAEAGRIAGVFPQQVAATVDQYLQAGDTATALQNLNVALQTAMAYRNATAAKKPQIMAAWDEMARWVQGKIDQVTRASQPSISPEQQKLLDEMYASLGAENEATVSRLGRELAGQRGLRPTDSPIFKEIARSQETFAKALASDKARTMLSLITGNQANQFNLDQLTQQARQQATTQRNLLLKPYLDQAATQMNQPGAMEQILNVLASSIMKGTSAGLTGAIENRINPPSSSFNFSLPTTGRITQPSGTWLSQMGGLRSSFVP